MEFLKEHLGEELYNQVADKLKGNDKVKLANLASGEYVSKQKFTDKESELNTLTNQFNQFKNDMKKFEGVDIDALNKKITDMETSHSEEILKIKKESAAKDYLGAFKYSSKSAQESILNKFLAKNLTFENDKFLGAEDFVKSLKEEDPGAFVEENNSNGKGGMINTGGNHNNSGTDELASMRAAMGLPVANK